MHEVRSIQDLLSQIRRGEILLPEFQRGYVWTRDQVRGLTQSLYRKHPTGHLLILAHLQARAGARRRSRRRRLLANAP